MKKRTLVCFLIFTLCVFHFSITDTVFGQDATPEELAQQVFDEHNLVLRRANIKQYLPGLLEGLKGPLPLGLTPAGLINFAVGSLKTDPTGKSLKTIAEGQGLTLTDEQIAIIADEDVQAVLAAENTKALLSLTGDDLTAGLNKFLELINAAEAIDPGKETKPDPAPPTISITTSRPSAQQGSFDVAFTTADVNGDVVTVTGSISVAPAEAAAYYSIPSGTLTSPVRITQVAPTTAVPTITGATVTLTLVANDGTADSSPATVAVPFATVEKPIDPPVKPPVKPPDKPEPPTDDKLVTSNLNGQSRLGGLSLNKIYARGFIEKLIRDAGLTPNPNTITEAVDFVLNQIPEGFLPKNQIRSVLTAESPISIFQKNEPPQVDDENFGNAISPALTDLLYTNVIPENRYLASDNMNVYVRVPNALTNGSVDFTLSGSPTKDGLRISPTEFKADTIPYTFKLEETLAATNLPAWPAVDPDGFPKIFREVVLRYSQEGLDGEYIALNMDPYDEDKGVVWKGDVGIIPGRNVFYYFEVTLMQPVKLNIVNPVALGEAIANPHGRHDEVATKAYTIESWAMPDPRNLQFQDRGIIDALLTADVGIEMFRLYLLSQGGNQIPFSEFNKLTQLLGRNANKLLTEFESNFDPKLSSVFTVPKIDYDTESLWVANFGKDEIADGNYTIEAAIRNADGERVDEIKIDFIADYSAPEADITFTPVANANADTSGYKNKDGIYVSTDKNGGPSALLDIGSKLTKGILGPDDGYLLYQVSGLDKDGNSITTWLPLTVESSMLVSDLWDIAKEQLKDNPLLKNLPENRQQLVDSLWSLPFNAVLGLITPGLIQELGNPELAKYGIRPINDARAKFIADLFGALVADIDAIPLTFDEDRVMRMAFLYNENGPGEYGIRALGIDNLLNIGSHVGATRLRVVKPEQDSSSITLASLGDLNGDGDANEPYESGTIYSNATDVTLTIMVDERSGAENHGIAHPGTITVQYENADGEWVTIGDPIKLDEAEHHKGTEFMHPWTVTDFDALIDAGDSVKLRTITRNDLDITTMTPEEEYFTIKLDDDVHPVDPKVLIVDLNDDSIVMTNPDSGAPQGTIELIVYTPRRTYPETTSLRIEVMRETDEKPIIIDKVEMGAAQDGTATAAIMFNGKALGEIYPSDTSMIHIDETSSYLKWTITVDTTMLPDTIEAPDAFDEVKLAAAHAASNPNGESYVTLDKNRYSVRATPIVDGDLPDNPNENPTAEGETYTDMFSVDNVDDVAPLRQNMITVSAGNDNTKVTKNDDGSFNVGGLVDKYDPEVDSPEITLTIKPGAKRDTYDSVHLFTSLPEGAIIGDVTETAEGSGEYTVMVDVGTLMDSTGLEMEPDGKVHNDRYLEDTYHANPDEFVYNPKGEVFSFTVYALTEDAAENRQGMDAFLNAGEILNADLSRTTAHEITINVQNTYRPDPGVLAISVVNSDGMVNPDSGAPQGELTFDVYTYGITSAPTKGIRVEVQRPIDDTWERITGTAEPSELVNVSEVAVTDLPDIIRNSDGITNSGVISALVDISEAEGGSPANLMKWTFTIDSRDLARLNADDEAIKLDDTINRGDGDSERDVTKDTNQYTVRAYALTPDNQNQVEYPKRDEYLERGGVEASFSLDNVDDVPPLGPTNITDVADHVGSLVANEDGSYTARGIVDDNVESTKLTFSVEPTAELITYEGGMIRLVQTGPDGAVTELPYASVDEGQLTVDIGLLENGAYMYYALVADEFGNWQVQGELDKPSPVITVHVLNFRTSDVTELTVTAVDGESPDRLPLQETIDELQGRFPLKESIAVSFNVNNGSLTLADLTAVVIGGQPRDGDNYTPGSGDAANSFSLMANNLSEVADGWYTPHGRVTIRERFVDFPLATINLDNTGPMIVIETPTEGHTVNDLPTLLAGFGDGDLGSGISDGSGVSAEDTAVVSLARLHQPEGAETLQEESIAVDQEMVEQNLDSVVYTRINKLAGGAYQFTVEVADKLGNVGEQIVTFAIEGINPIVVLNASSIAGQTLDQSPKEITGFFAGGGDTEITKFTIYDAQGDEFYNADEAALEALNAQDENIFTFTPDKPFVDGFYKVAAQVTDGSELTADASFTFTVKLPVPAVAIVTPIADQVNNDGMPTITGEFSGATSANNPIEVKLLIDGNEVTPTVNDKNQVTHTPASDPDYKVTVSKQFTYTPETALDDGPHKVTVIVTDANDRTAETSTDFIVDIPGPTVMIHVPDAGQIYDISKPVFQGDLSGVATPVTLSLTLDGEPVEADKGDSTSAEVGNNTYTYTPFTYKPADPLDDGEFTLVAVATDANGKTAKATAIFTIRLPVPTVTLDSPVAGGIYDHTYRHISGEFTGVDPVEVTLMVNGTAVEEIVDGNEFTYDLTDKLAEGEHTVSVEITDANDNTAQATTKFTVTYPEASVSIDSPVAGGIYDHTYRHISGEFTGVDPVEVTLMVNGTAVEEIVDGNEFTYDLTDKLVEGEHTVSVSVEDANGETAQASTTFTVVYPEASVSIQSPPAGSTTDHTFRHIAGEFTGVGEVVVNLMLDGEAVEATIEGNQFGADLSDKLSEGDHLVSVMVTDANGETAEASSLFSVVYPEASVSIQSPEAGDTYDHTFRHISGEFTGVGEVAVSLMVDGEAVEATIEDNQFSADLSDRLSEGDHVVSVMVTDENGETAEASSLFTVVYPDASVSIQSPPAGSTTDHTFRHIAGEFTGVGEVAVSLMLDGEVVEATIDGNQFSADLSDKLTEGDHLVSVMVTDANGETAEASSLFSVVYPEASVSIQSPEAGDTYDHTFRHISGEFTGVGEVAVSLMLDGEAVEATIEDNQFSADLSDRLSEGDHVVSVMVTDANGETAEASSSFSVVYPDASVSIQSPPAGSTTDHTFRHIAGEFTGVGEVVVNLMLDGEVVEATIDGNQFSADLSDKLSEGDHLVSVMVTDANGETAEASSLFTVVYPEASVSIQSPAAGHTYDHTFRHIAGEFTGVGEVVVSLMLDGEPVEATIEGNQFSADLSDKLSEGDHMVTVMVTDANGETAEESVSITVVYPEASVSIQSPAAGDTYDHTFRHISGEFTGVGEVVVSLMVDGKAVAATIEDNQFNADLSDKLSEGDHLVSVMVTDANGETAEASSSFSVVYPDATVMLLSPTAGHTYTNGTPVISGEFTGVGEVKVKLTVDGKDTKVSVDGNQFTGELDGALGHGMHTVAVEVTDANGESAKTSAEFMVDLPPPTVAIHSPAPGQTYGNGETINIRVEFTGMDASVTSFTINGEDVEVEPEDNMFTHTPDGLTTGEYVVAVEVTDAANNKKAQDTVVFNVKLDATPPVISEVAPSGTLHDTWVNISAVVSDEESDITGVDFFIRNEDDTHKGFLPLGTVITGAQNSATAQQIADGNVLTQGSFEPGTHTLQVIATSEGGSSSHTWSFTVVTDNVKPTITSIAPSGTLHAGLPTISASAHDESGVAEIVITVMDSSGEAVEGKTQNDDEEGSVGITRADFMPEMPLDEGTYVVEVRATDTFGNTSSAKGGFTIDFDTAAPLITSSSPQNGARLMYAHDDEKRPTISITYGDAETGVNVDSIRFVFNDQLINLTDDQKSATQVLYMPPADLEPGQYTVKIEVSDNAQMQGNVSDEAEGAREANTAVYEFSFFVEHGEVPILKAAPFNYPNPFKDNTRISFVLARRSNVSITIYDVTLRPVRTLVDNEVMEAGYYTPAADSKTNPFSSIGWDGKSSNGEDLARGIYFCEIMVTDGVEPEYAILKLALTR